MGSRLGLAAHRLRRLAALTPSPFSAALAAIASTAWCRRLDLVWEEVMLRAMHCRPASLR